MWSPTAGRLVYNDRNQSTGCLGVVRDLPEKDMSELPRLMEML